MVLSCCSVSIKFLSHFKFSWFEWAYLNGEIPSYPSTVSQHYNFKPVENLSCPHKHQLKKHPSLFLRRKSQLSALTTAPLCHPQNTTCWHVSQFSCQLVMAAKSWRRLFDSAFGVLWRKPRKVCRNHLMYHRNTSRSLRSKEREVSTLKKGICHLLNLCKHLTYI